VKGVKLGWVDAVKFPHFLSFFNLSFRESENIQGMLILEGRKRRYTLLHGEIHSHTLAQWAADARNGKVKFVDLPRDVPSLVELPPASMFDFEWISWIIRFCANNVIVVMVLFVLLHTFAVKKQLTPLRR